MGYAPAAIRFRGPAACITCQLTPHSRVDERVASTAIWVAVRQHFGLNQGPNVLMIENYRSAFNWRLMQRCPYLVTGLRQASFVGGWLGEI